ncbi:MAG: NAD(P)-dependent oxidoreductase, partial [Candidatus Binatia bacterium]
LGLIGERMARRVLKAGYPLAVYDVRPAQMESLVKEGAEAAASPKDAAARCSTLLLSLPDSDIVEAVCLGKDGIIHGAQPGTIVVDLTSGDPPHTVKISDRLAEDGIKMIDVGVAGSFPQAEKGTLGVIAGGDIEALDKVWPVLKSFSDRRYHLGKIGSGHFVKSLNNFLGAAYYVAACEAIIVAAKAGLDPNKVLEVLNEGGGRSTATENRIPAWLKRDFSRGMAVELLVKDVATTCGLGREHKTPMFMANTLHQLLMHAAAEIGYKEHNGAIAKAFEKWAEFEVKVS